MAADKIAEAEPLYEGREDMTKARLAVTALRQAHAADYGNYEAAWKLARAAFYVGDRTDNDTERDDMFREGTDAGKAAVQLQPNKPEGHFWLGANYGGSAAHSTLSNLSSFQDIKGEMEAVLKLDESYQGYSAYLGLGRLYLQAPKVLGGDTAKAIEYLEKGVKLNPTTRSCGFTSPSLRSEQPRRGSEEADRNVDVDYSRSEVHGGAQRCSRESEETAGEN